MSYATEEAMGRAVRTICKDYPYDNPKLNKPLPENGIYHKTGISAGRAPGAKEAEAAYGLSALLNEQNSNKNNS